MSGHKGTVFCLKFDLESKYLISGSDDSNIKVWDALTGRLLKTLRAHTGEISDLCISSDNRLLASGSYDFNVRLWSIDNNFEPFACLDGHRAKINSISFCPVAQKNLLLSTDDFGEWILWDTATGMHKFSSCVNKICQQISLSGPLLYRIYQRIGRTADDYARPRRRINGKNFTISQVSWN